MRHFFPLLLIGQAFICQAIFAQAPSEGFLRNTKEEHLYFADTARFFEKRTEIGVALGALRYNGDLSNDRSLRTGALRPAAAFFVRRHLIPNLALRGNVLLGQMADNDRAYTTPEWRQARNISFKSTVSELSLQAEWDILGKKRYRRVDTVVYELDRYRQIAHVNVFRRILAPYLFAGGGLLMTKAQPVFDPAYLMEADQAAKAQADLNEAADWQARPGFSFGGGLNLDLSREWVLGLELGTRTALSDYFDGVSQTGNPDKPDWYFFGGLNLAYRLGTRDKDGDGLPDNRDKCPETPGTGRTFGCPDADRDGIPDRDDECPHRYGIVGLGGCPLKDFDNDSVPDADDLCPKVAGLVKFQGCPDTDGDGVEDKLDSCLNLVGLPQFNGCPDTDGDGIEDKLDACPREKGPAEYYYGCPVRDTDGDGVEDKLDVCLLAPGKAEFKGCPDTDGDGVEDSADLCPSIAGLKDNKGCPKLEKKEQEKLELAVKAVKFQSGKAILKPESNKILDDISAILLKYPHYGLSIEGHTDNAGNDQSNQLLSDKRARACLDFLLKKGVDTARLKSAGYGESRPVADNKTPAGRTQNRRVEFNLFLVEKK
jgi:outer membrane protein OmpA-like peptidoglycan-associated protein